MAKSGEVGRTNSDFATRSLSSIATGGVLFTAWWRCVNQLPATGSRSNAEIFSCQAGDWLIRGIVGNGSTSGGTGNLNCNLMLFTMPGAVYVNDFAYYDTGGYTQNQLNGWNWVAWWVQPGSTFTMRQWLKIGPRGPVFLATSGGTDVSTDIPGADDPPTALSWATDASSAPDNAYLWHATVRAKSSSPSLAELEAIAYRTSPDATAFGDWLLQAPGGTLGLLDQSGNNRTLTANGGSTFYQGVDGPSLGDGIQVEAGVPPNFGPLNLPPFWPPSQTWGDTTPAAAPSGNDFAMAATVPVATSTATLESTDSFTVAGTAPVATSSVALASSDSLAVAATVPAATSAATVVSTDVVTVAATAPVATMATALGVPDYVVTAAATVPAPTCAAALESTDVVTVTATSPVATMAGSLASTDSFTVAGTAPVATSVVSLGSTDSLTVAGVAPVSTMVTILAVTDYVVTVAAVAPVATSAVAVASTDALAVAATVPAPTSSIALDAPNSLAVSATVPVATCAALLASTDSLAVAATSPAPTMATTLEAGTISVAVDAVIPVSTCSATMVSTDAFGVIATVPGPTMTASLAADLVVIVAAMSPVATMVATLTIPVVAPPVTSPWAKIMKPRYPRWGRRRDGQV